MMKRCISSDHKKVDRISNLPDAIQNHILSFLPTEEAIRSSILSTQWRSIWSSLSVLKLDQYKFDNKKHPTPTEDFMNIVDRLLFNHSELDVRTFHLILRFDNKLITEHHINEWISCLVTHNVRELCLRDDSGELKSPPFCLFTCSSLTVLKLTDIDLKLPSLIKLPSLKTMILYVVSFCDDNLTENFFSSCPALENLSLEYCKLKDAKSFTISAPKLKFFSIDTDQCLQHEVNICTPSLKEISYRAFRPPRISSETLSSLLVASFTFLWPQDGLVTSPCEILNGLRNVVKLHLRQSYFEILCRDPDVSRRLSNCCPSLEYLVVLASPIKSHIQVLTFLLRGFQKLQTLRICFEENETGSSMLNMEAYCQSLDFSTSSILMKLKTIEINGFSGSEDELDLVKYLLASAIALEKISIWFCGKSTEPESQLRIAQKLLNLTRISPHATIDLL